MGSPFSLFCVQVSRARAENFARSIGAIILDTSAKENFGVAELFAAVSERVIELRGAELSARSPAPRATLIEIHLIEILLRYSLRDSLRDSL